MVLFQYQKKSIMDTTGMMCPSISQREGESMQSRGGPSRKAESRASSMELKKRLSEGGETVLPALSTVSVSTLPNATSVNHTAKSTPAVPVVGWKGLKFTHTASTA